MPGSFCVHSKLTAVPTWRSSQCSRKVQARAELDINKVSAGGVLLQANKSPGHDQAHLGEVLGVGTKVEVKVSKGDTVMYARQGTSEVEAADGKVVFVWEKSVLGVCE